MDVQDDEEPTNAFGTDPQFLSTLFDMAVGGNISLFNALARAGLDANIQIPVVIGHASDCSCHNAFEIPALNVHSLAIIRDWIKVGHCPHIIDDRENNVLVTMHLVHYAAICNQTELLRHLVEKGALVNARTEPLHQTALHFLASNPERPSVECVQFWLASGADVNIQDANGDTPLHLAAEKDFNDILPALVSSGADVDICNDDHESALLIATLHGHEDCVKTLVDGGAEVNPSRSQNPVTIAVRHSRTEVLRILLLAPTLKLHDSSSLLQAVYQGNVEITKMLLEAGFDPDFKAEGDYTPLIVSASSDNKSIVSLLIQHGANVNITNHHGYAAIHLAAWDGYLEIVQNLLDNGAFPDVQTADRNTPLALACHGNNFEVLEILLSLNCNVNNADKDNDTPLLYATYNGCLQSVTGLLANGANPNFRNSHGTTPLWNAVYQKHEEIVPLLIQAGVDLDVASRGIDQHAQTEHVVLIYEDERTPLHVAFLRGCANIGKILLLAGSDLSKEKWLWAAQYPNALRNDPATLEWVVKAATSPQPLKRQCRTFFKKMMGMNLNKHVQSLDIPSTLRDFLILKYL